MKKEQNNEKSTTELHDKLNEMQYETLVKQENDNFFLFIPDLQLAVKNKSLEAAYEDLKKKREELLLNVVETGFEDYLPKPQTFTSKTNTFNQLKLFVYKVLIVIVILTVPAGIGGRIVMNKITSISQRLNPDSIIANVKNRILSKKNLVFLIAAGKQVVNNMESSLIDAPEEIKQRRLERVKHLVNALQPFSQELSRLTVPDENKKIEKSN